jgi:threonine dehydratase
MTVIHPFDDVQLITGQGTLGMEIFDDFPQADVAVVPIGGGGLISGVSMALKARNPRIRVIGVESSDGPAMKKSVEAGQVVTLESIGTIIDGLRVKRVGENTFRVVRDYVDEIVALPDAQIFEAMIWIMSHCKLVAEGAAAAPVAALLNGLVKAPAGSKVVCVLSGGNLNLDQLRGMKWN